MNQTVGALHDEAARALVGTAEPGREAQILLGHALGVSRAWLAGHMSDRVDPAPAALFRDLVRRRVDGEPVAYLIGCKEFYGLNFRVTPDVLIPRPDTETLVDAALQKIPRTAVEVLDLGTGSGCVAVAIANERPAISITAVDISAEALEIARANAQANGVHVHFIRSNWFAGLGQQRFDIIVSNPPYIAAGDVHLQQGDLRFEPEGALVSRPDGLADLRLIVAGAPRHLREGGWLLFEHGHDQAVASRDLLHDAGFCDVISHSDLSGTSRVAAGRLLTLKSPNR